MKLLSLIITVSLFSFLISCVKKSKRDPIFTGRIQSVDDQGISNVIISLSRNTSGWIVDAEDYYNETTTDENGFYSLTADQSKVVGLFLTINFPDSIHTTYPKYLFPKSGRNPSLKIDYTSIGDIIVTNYEIPKKGYIRIKLNNLTSYSSSSFSTYASFRENDFINSKWHFPFIEKSETFYASHDQESSETVHWCPIGANSEINLMRLKPGSFTHLVEDIVCLTNTDTLFFEYEY